MSILSVFVHSDGDTRHSIAARRHHAGEWIVRHAWGAGLAFSILVWGVLATVLLVH